MSLQSKNRDKNFFLEEMESSASDESHSPTRMNTRGGPKVNYAELNSSGTGVRHVEEVHDDVVFRSPSASVRGRKRRVVHEDGTASEFSITPAKRGRPRGSGTSGRGGRGGLRRPPGSDTEDRGLFGAVKNGRNLEAAIDEWVSAYENDSDKALIALQQFFISACGCKGMLDSQMLATMEYKDIIRRMTEDFDEESGDYPLVMSGPQYKKFRANFADMLMLLVGKCKSGIIFDQRMMDSVIQLLTGLADSQVRAFRHTSTFAAMKISSALVDVTIELTLLKDRNQKQVQAEKSKVEQQKATSEKLSALIQKKAEIEERTEDVRQMLQFIFKSVFVHRYRDVLPDIRSLCIQELGNWVDVYPDFFLEDSYLKYIGWSLHDKVPEVRGKCLTTLLPLYNRSDFSAKLELFTHKFKDRLVTMVMDRESDVAIKACHLITNIYRLFPSLLTVKDCVPVYEQVYANQRALAVAAGEFLNTKVFQVSSNSREECARRILDLVQFFIEGEVHDHASYLVDALIETNPMLKEYQVMVDLLLSDDAEGSETQLLDILSCSVRQGATGESPVGRNPVKRGGAPAPANAKELKTLREERVRISEVLIPAIPLLINKFIADREKVANLVGLPLHFLLDVYMSSHGERNLQMLMEAVKDVMERHADDEILSMTAELIAYLMTNTLTNQQTESFRIGLVDSLSLELRTAIARFQNERQLDEEDEAALLSAFRKMAAVLSHIDIRRGDLWETVMPVVAAISEGKPCGREVLDVAIHVLALCLLYDLQRISKEESAKQDAIKKLKKKRDHFVQVLEGILSHFASNVESAFKWLADILICFNMDALSSDSLRGLHLQVKDDLAKKMLTFVEDNVFAESGGAPLEQAAEIELTQKKRSLLAQFCKLVMHGVLDFSHAAPLLTHYLKFYQDFGDILKLLLCKTRDMDKMQNARCIIKALECAFDNAQREAGAGGLSAESAEFSSLRELARRLSAALGSDHIKNRDPLALIHRDGVLFALEVEPQPPAAKRSEVPVPPNLSFLEILQEFSYKLLKQDKQAIMNYLDKKTADLALPPPVDSSLLLYRNSLIERSDDSSSMRSAPVGRGRGRGRPRGGSIRATPTPSEI